ncbi:hypothetical protein [Sphaerospermopsis torques-reginae]|uniref:Uncharacterized protein n=1 Tax=Sphaerospermopsis torques-reginae ITEP-024 TaxID=984208 RepID=A0ABX8X2P4_9CYAN|nr:hypothetical protein [Sphaerospermopsis torques-reginae]QYX32987.1 hypothetical protein K2F26_06505 [Sphaerospermopsis torques-reginae ITEP-024]
MLRIFQNAKRLISVCLATLLIVVSTITIFPSTASADNNVVKIECTSDCGNIFSFVTGMVSGSAVTIIALTTNTTSLVATGAAIGQTAVTALATLGTAATTVVSAPVLVPVAATVAVGAVGGYVASQVVNSFNDNHSQNAN